MFYVEYENEVNATENGYMPLMSFYVVSIVMLCCINISYTKDFTSP